MVTTKTRAAAEQTAPADKPTAIVRRRFTVAEYLRMDEAGIFHPEERTELLDGEILSMSPIGSPHVMCLTTVTDWWYAHRPVDVIIRVQAPIRLSSHSLPQPDLAIVRYQPGRYVDEHPDPEDVLLVIEVADKSLAYDRGRKRDLYAAAGIRDYWIAAVKPKRFIVHREPVDGVCTEVFEVSLGGAIAPLAWPEITLAVDEFFG
ncbi:MAG: Uma2 family endonuclease [Dehalococcoidia bacterium]